MRLTFEIVRQAGPGEKPRTERFELADVAPQMSILDALDVLSSTLVEEGGEAIAVESDCREGICGACGVTVNGRPHGPEARTPTCHQRLGGFSDGEVVRLEPLRSAAYPVVRDLVVDRSALDAVIAAGGHVGVPAGTAPDADATPVAADIAEQSLDYAACIGCGACVAACPNGSGQLFIGAKLAHLARLPMAEKERGKRARAMTERADMLFGPCSLYGACEAVCPAGIPLEAVSIAAAERLQASRRGKGRPG